MLLFLMGQVSGYAQPFRSDSLLRVLKGELTRESLYERQKANRIARLQLTLLHTDSTRFNARFNLYSAIFEEYHSYKFDSAFVYVQQLTALCERFQQKDSLARSTILLGTILLNSGLYKEAFDVIEKMDTAGLANRLRSDYLVLRARLYGGIGEYDNDAFFTERYYRKADEDYNSADRLTPPSDFEHTIDLAFIPDSVKQKHLTPDFYYHLITNRPMPAHNLAMVAARLSFAFSGEDRLCFIILAAINDIRSCTKETLAVFLLGQELFKMNRTNDAFLFMQEADRNAVFYGTRNRALQIESMLPLISAKLVDEKQHQKDKLLIWFLVSLIVGGILFFLLVIYRRQMLRIKDSEGMIREKNAELQRVNARLWESSKIKEELIGLFFKTCSSYIDMLQTATRETQHYIKLGKYNEVLRLLKNMEIDREKGNLYKMLDSSFLTMFPGFIAAFNALLPEEDRVWPKPGETLNPTVRIFALMRLGVTGNEAIAKILDYSVSTIYTYKARIKSRALVPAIDFERKIMEIEFIGI
ncbi:DUF6377 domain-containing protein [Niastella koreensis]|uniref:DUF6377 domain-containing protein n=1 Tax=Niastella koreensis TaxID=354356 RepID=UPI0002D91C72|nr:DUF6377 domain-containing protein [Niastella koreensis]